MEWLQITFALYRKVFTRAAILAVRNWAVLATIFAYGVVLAVTPLIVLPLGMAGGFIYGMVQAGCAGSFLYMVEMIVRTSKVDVRDFRRSIGAYLWEVVAVLFLLWIVGLLRPAIADLPQGEVLLIFVYLSVFVLLNAVPELIYLTHSAGMAVVGESYAFVAGNWIEWFPANIAAAAGMYAVAQLPVIGILIYAKAALIALLLYFVMIMRGLLFIELHGSNYRARAFKYRMER